MVLFSIYICLILLCLILPKSKKVFLITLGFLWFLATFCDSMADSAVYQMRYSEYLSVSSMTEMGYTMLMYLFNRLGFSYVSFLAVIYAVIIGVFAWFIWNYSNRPNTTLALYAIFSFTIDMVQIRNTLAFAIVLIGLSKVLREINRKSVISFIVCVIVGTALHFSVALFLFLLVPLLLDTKKTILITAITGVVIAIASNVSIVESIIGNFVGLDRAASVIGRISKYDAHSIFTIQMVIIISTIIVSVLLIAVAYNLNRKMFYDYEDYERNMAWKNKAAQCLKIHLALLITLPLVPFVLDVYRINRYVLLLAYICFSYYRIGDRKRNLVSRKAFTVMNFIGVLMLFYVQIYSLNDFYRAFWTFFENNMFI